jgi:hypothetical protein
MSRFRTVQEKSAPATRIGDSEAREMALFLVRVFGEEASEVAAERAIDSEQKQDWKRVAGEVEKLLDDSDALIEPDRLRRLG